MKGGGSEGRALANSAKLQNALGGEGSGDVPINVSAHQVCTTGNRILTASSRSQTVRLTCLRPFTAAIGLRP